MTPVLKYTVAFFVFLSAVVILAPQWFYFADSGVNIAEARSKDRYEYTLTDFRASIEATQRGLEDTEARIKDIKKSQPFFGRPSRESEIALQQETSIMQGYQQDMVELQETKTAMMTQYRAHSPVWSQFAFEEMRELYLERQKSHAGSAFRGWTWSMMFNGLMGGGRDDNALSQLAGMLIKLLFHFTVGSVMSLVDFLIRVPFYLQDYDTMPIPEESGTYHADLDLLPGGVGSVAEVSLQVSPVDAVLGRSGIVSSSLFFVLMAVGAIGGTAVIIALIWSPVMLCIAAAVYNAKNNPNRRGRQQQQQQQRQFRPKSD
jgi:hypothetical protein